MGALAGLSQVELSPPPHHRAAELNVVLEQGFDAQDPGLAVHQRQHVDVEGRLHGRVLVEVVEHLLREGAPLELDDDPHALPARFVPHLGDALELLLLDLGGYLLHQGGLVHLVG